MATTKRPRERLISVREVCERTGWHPMTVFNQADSGYIPGAVWGRTLQFKEEEIEAWFEPVTKPEIEQRLKQLEQDGFLTSFLDTDGKRHYITIERMH